MPFPYPALSMVPLSCSHHGRNPHPVESWPLQPRAKLRREQWRLQQQLAWRASRATSKIIWEEEKILKKPNPDTLITEFL